MFDSKEVANALIGIEVGKICAKEAMSKKDSILTCSNTAVRTACQEGIKAIEQHDEGRISTAKLLARVGLASSALSKHAKETGKDKSSKTCQSLKTLVPSTRCMYTTYSQTPFLVASDAFRYALPSSSSDRMSALTDGNESGSAVVEELSEISTSSSSLTSYSSS